jgi:prolyl oligopeptidase
MRLPALSLPLAIMTLVSCSPVQPTPPPLAYPPTAKGEVVDTYHGTQVPDPYRWMEDLDAKDVADWVAAQNAVTDPYLAALPLRASLNARLTELWNYQRVGLPTREGGTYFYAKNTGLQRQSVIYARTSLEAEPTVAIDPNAISPDGTTSLAQYAPAPDATHLAYALSEGGADWQTLKVRHLASGQDLADEVKWMRFSGLSWSKDSKGFFYSRYPEPPKNKVLEAALSGQALYYHRIGTPQSEDVLVYERKDLATWLINGLVTEDGRYLLITMAEGSGNQNRLYYADLGTGRVPNVSAPVRPLIDTDDAEFAPIGNRGSVLYLRSDKDAPNRRVIAVDIANPAPAAWKTIVPEQKEALESVALIGGRIVAQYLVDVQSRLVLFSLDGTREGDISLPGVGTVAGIGGREDAPEIWYGFSAPLTPSTVYRYDPGTRQSQAFEAPTAPIDASRYETRALFATSKDGTRVPFFMTARKDLPTDGSNPTMLYGYGGFSISTTPTYRADVPAWLELGGVWVTVSMRGGAEYGEAWHQAGMLDRKQNVFDDFIAVADHLIAEEITSPARLGVMGGSNGGLLVGAVVNQRPDLYAVALPAVGVMDMLRYERFTGGRFWVSEYGSAQNPAQFPFLIKYSPVQNVKAGTCYPATLVTTADHDDRVVPSHSFKYAAALQAAQSCPRPTLIRVEVSGSHGYRPTDKLIAERADQWAFAAEAMGIRGQ